MRKPRYKRRADRDRAKQLAIASGYYKPYFGLGLRLWMNGKFYL
jgi:hypothetical protein